MKKVGQLIACVWPAVALMVLQLAASVFVIAAYLISYVAKNGFDFFYIINSISGITQEKSYMASTIIVYEVIALLFFVTMYRYAMGEKNNRKIHECISKRSVLSIIVLFVGIEVVISLFLTVFGDFFPEIMENYSELIKESGLADFSVSSILATIVLAPIVEEFAFRGITFKCARKFTGYFWLANFIQAAMFGLAHMNIVQSSYAFVMGLFLGYVYRKYNSLVASILAHLGFNFAGTFLAAIIFGTSDQLGILKGFVVAFLGMLTVYIGFRLVLDDYKTIAGEEAFFEKYRLENIRCKKVLTSEE